MFVQLSMACVLIGATVAIQALFMSAGLRQFSSIQENRSTILTRSPTVMTVIWVLFLIIPIILDITLWAVFYYLQQALPTFEESLYFSTVTFTTVGYGDIVLSREWRQLATFEAINGWIIFGWATALIMAVIQRVYFGPQAQRDK